MPDTAEHHIPLAHGGSDLPEVTLDDYNIELKSGAGFVGDRASKGAFNEILEEWRERLRRVDSDPLGDTPTAELSKKRLEKILASDDLEAVGLVHSAIEEFAGELTAVIRRFLRVKAWRDTARIAIGGGFSGSRMGELAIGRASVLLKADGIETELVPIGHHPDEAGLIGAVHLVPRWMIAGHDAILAADIGGTNMRVGIIAHDPKKRPYGAKSSVVKLELWRHADDKPSREEAVAHLVGMLKTLIAAAAKEKIVLAPFIGIGCPGVVTPDGMIESGGQNLPGNWQSQRFNLPTALREAIPQIGDEATSVLLHNDAVVQGLSQTPFMRDVEGWGVLTIGTGLGNAHFTNKGANEKAKEKEKE